MNSKICTCNKCECDLNTAHEKEKEILRVHDFLSGLDDSAHGVIRSQLCAITPLPDLDSVYQTITQNETLRLNTTTEVPVMSFSTQAAPNRRPGPVYTHDLGKQSSFDSAAVRGGQGTRDSQHQCSVCGKPGHDAASCFKVIGYPEWWGERSKNMSDNRGDNRASSARRGRGYIPRANVTQINTAVAGQSSGLTDNDRQGLSGLSDEQWATVQKLINAGKATANQSGKINDIHRRDTPHDRTD